MPRSKPNGKPRKAMAKAGRRPFSSKYSEEQREKRRRQQNAWYQSKKETDPDYLRRRIQRQHAYNQERRLMKQREAESRELASVADTLQKSESKFKENLLLHKLFCLMHEVEFAGIGHRTCKTAAKVRMFAKEHSIDLSEHNYDALLIRFQYKCYVKFNNRLVGPVYNPANVMVRNLETGEMHSGSGIAVNRQLREYGKAVHKHEQRLIKEAQQNAKRELKRRNKN